MKYRGKIGWIIYLCCLGMIAPISTFAQTIEELAFVGTQNLPGSAYSKSMGGAQSSFGTLSATTINPAAGVEVRSSALVFCPEYIIRKSKFDFLGSSQIESTSNFNTNTFGFIINSQGLDDITSDDISVDDAFEEEPRKEFAFGVVWNRSNNFNREYGYDQFNYKNSVTEYFGDLSEQSGLQKDVLINILNLYKLDELALITYLTNLDSNDIYSIGAAEGEGIYQTYLSHADGSLNNLDFSFSKELSPKLSIGVANSMRVYRYKYTREITEADSEDVYPYFLNLKYVENFTTSGIGFNWKFGAIYKPIKGLNVGLSYQTGNRINSSREYFISLEGNFINHPEIIQDPTLGGDTVSHQEARSGSLDAAYGMKTPGRWTGGLTLHNDKIGKISADVEYLQYGNNPFKDNGSDDPNLNYDVLNETARMRLVSNVNLRLGGELILNTNRIRLGAAFYNMIENDYMPSRTYLTIGYGIDKKTHFFNFSYLKQFSTTIFNSYPVDGIREQGTIKSIGTDIVVSYGLRF